MNLVQSRIENTVCGPIGAFTEKEQANCYKNFSMNM